MDIFDLEASIMSCWNTKDDVELLAESFSNQEMNEDQILNCLLGIANLHEMRCKKLMDIFEKLIENHIITSDYCK